VTIDDLPREIAGVSSRRAEIAARTTRLIERRAGTIVAIFFVVVAMCCVLASRLRVDQELRRLLPDHFPSVVGIDRIAAEIGNQADLYVTIRSPSRAANLELGHAVAQALAGDPRLRSVVFHRDRSFFDRHALLYADIADLLELRRKVIGRIRREVAREAYGDLSLMRAEDRAPADDRLGWDRDEIEREYGAKEDFAEYYEADEGRLVVVRARPISLPTDVARAHALLADVQAAIDDLEPASFHPQMDVKLDGAHAQISGRVRTFEREIMGGTLASLFVLVASLALYFRSVRVTVLVFVPLVGAIVVSLAFAAVTYGFLNLVSAFIFAILLGLGIDFSIVLLARWRDERARGLSRPAATMVVLATTGPASLFGGASTALGFGVLAIADFQGFAQFGAVATVGVFAALLGALLVMPALAVLLDRVHPWNPAVRPGARRPPAATRRWSAIAAVVVALGVGFAALSLSRADHLEFEYDFDKLGPERRQEAERLGYRDAIGKSRTVAPAVAMCDDLEQAEAVYRQIAALRAIDPATDLDLPSLWREGSGAPNDWREIVDADVDVDDEVDEFGDPDLDEPKFTTMETAVTKRPRIPTTAAEILSTYPAPRVLEMADRLHDVTSVFAFIPESQTDKLTIIADIRRRIDARRGALSSRTRAEIDEWYRYLEVDTPIAVEALPEWVRDQFTDASGNVGRFVVIWTRGSKADYENVRRIYDAYRELDTPSGKVELAADFFVIPEVYEAIRADGPKVIALSFLVMLLTSVLTFRTLSAALAAAVMVPFALVWLLGVMELVDWRLNFFNVIALPLLVGMGEDSSLHMIARYREEGSGRVGVVLRETGGAIAMTAWTTMCGFGAILWSNHRGLRSLAWVSVIGIALVFLASVALLPALMLLRERYRARVHSTIRR
jgi:hypothetical protein